MVQSIGDRSSNIIHGLGFNPNQDEDIRVTVIATGFMDGGEALEKKTGLTELPSPKAEISSVETMDLDSMDDIEIPTFLRRKLHAQLDQVPAAS